jgi:hypothetical protein
MSGFGSRKRNFHARKGCCAPQRFQGQGWADVFTSYGVTEEDQAECWRLAHAAGALVGFMTRLEFWLENDRRSVRRLVTPRAGFHLTAQPDPDSPQNDS